MTVRRKRSQKSLARQQLKQEKRKQRLAERQTLGMLLQAEWKPHLQCFVKARHDEPDESDGFVWPAPSFEFYDREGREITGKRKAAILKHQKYSNEASWSAGRNRVFAPSPISTKIKTATEVQFQMEASIKKATEDMAKQMDDHFMDALMYGQSFGEVKTLKEPPKLDTIKIRTIHDSMKVMRPGLNVTKVTAI